MALRFDSTLLKNSELVIMQEHVREILALDWAKDSTLLHDPILEGSEKLVKAFFKGDYGQFVAVLPGLKALYLQCPEDGSWNLGSGASGKGPSNGLKSAELKGAGSHEESADHCQQLCGATENQYDKDLSQVGKQSIEPVAEKNIALRAVSEPMRSETIRPSDPCHTCHEYAWWVSIYGVLVCGYCHPPASPELVMVRLSIGQAEEKRDRNMLSRDGMNHPCERDEKGK